LFFVTVSVAPVGGQAGEGHLQKKQKRMPLQSGLGFPLTKNERSNSATQKHESNDSYHRR
jgi:hypothetical protein